MTAARRFALGALACWSFAARPGSAQEVKIEDVNGIRYQVTRRVVPRQMPVYEMRDQQQTVYRQQVTTDVLQQQQLYTVPVTQYQLVSRLHGRWNPFITPYWTHRYEPVTTWQQQAATVQIPISRVGWTPETRVVQTPTLTYRTANEESITRVAIGVTPAPSGSTAVAAGGGPTATLAARPPAPAASTPYVAGIGGVQMSSDPPRQATGWQAPAADSRYR